MSSGALEIVLSLAVALGAGFVVGAEREHHEAGGFAGARTFPLFSLAGAVGMLLGVPVLLALGGALGLLVGLAYFRDTRADGADTGISTEAAAIVTFGIGALCTAQDIGLGVEDRLLVAAALATAVMSLLTFKRRLHGFVSRLSDSDFVAAAKLLVLGAVLLPLLPSRDMGPWQAFNPHQLGLLVFLIAGISFAGYVAMRALGPRVGLGLTGLLGGLVSSTAVTLTFSGRARDEPRLRTACAVAIVLASATMFPRILVEVYAASPALLPALLLPFSAAGLVGLIAAAFLFVLARREESAGEPREGHVPAPIAVQVENPFSILSALKFAVAFAAVLLISRAATHYLDEAGLYLAALASGLADVDPITLSIARMHAVGDLQSASAVIGIFVAFLAYYLVLLWHIRFLGLLVGAWLVP